MSGYRRGGYRRSYAPTVGRVSKVNARPGPCRYCGETVAAGAGQLWRDDNGWSAVHLPASWHGSPVSGGYINGCPGEADKLNARPGSAPAEAPRDTRGGYLDECGSCGMASCSC